MRLSVPIFFLLWVKALTLKNLNYSVPEEQGPGTVIGNIAKDAGYGTMERGKKSNFRVLENSAAHLVDVDPESGLIFTKQRIDRETLCRRNPKCQLSMEVFANDKEICMIKIDIQDINDNSPSFPSDHVNIDISENAAAGTRFPLTIAHDSDSGENGIKTYQVTRDDYNTFSLDLKVRGDGTIYPELVVQRPLDREDQSHHTLLLTAIDGGEYPRSGSMQINVRVTDSNDNSPVFEKSSYVIEIPENSPPGKILIDLNATDQDEGSNGQVVYSFTGYASERIQDLFSIDPNTGVVKVQGEIDYEENPIIEFDVQAKDLGPNPIPGHCKITVKVLDKNDNSPIISFVSVRQGAISEAAPPESVIALVRVTDKDSGRNAEIPVPRNVGIGYIVATVKAVDHDHGESGHLTYEITEGNDDHLFEMDPVGGEVRTTHALWEEVTPVVELVVKVTDHGKPPLSAVAKLIIKANTETAAGGGSSMSGEQQHWDVSLPLIVTLCIISVMLLAVMTAIAVKSKHQDKETGNYNCRMAEYSNPPVGKGKKKRINKSDIMLVQSEMEERDSASRMNVVSSPSLITSPICFDYQSPLPLTLPRSEVMYLKTTTNSLTVPRAGCHSSFAGLSTDTPANRMSVIQTENFPSEPNYAGSRQPFVQSSTFKDAERASLRDSGHGDSDQADSDQDTNKGSHCDTSAREALKMKATAVNGQPFEQGLFILTLAGSNNKCLTVFAEQDKSVHCTDECRALGHSDRCWMPKLRVGSQADSADNRTNLFIPVGMDAMVETEIYGTISRSSRKTLSTFGKEQRDSTILVANVKPYLKSQRALSPPLQESPSASSSPSKSSMPLDFTNQESKEEREGGSDSSAYGPPDGQCSPLHTEMEEPSYLTCELRPKSLSSSLIHSSVISQECGGSEFVLDPRDSGN
ncbi:hypothetical protein PAMP_003770 [Pampus punctatissimus]